MIDFICFIGGFTIGIILYYVAYILIISHKSKIEFEKYKKYWNDPTTEKFLSNDEGEKIWSNKKGCIGPSANIKL